MHCGFLERLANAGNWTLRWSIVSFGCESDSESGLSGGILYFVDVTVTIILQQGLNCSSQGRNPI